MIDAAKAIGSSVSQTSMSVMLGNARNDGAALLDPAGAGVVQAQPQGRDGLHGHHDVLGRPRSTSAPCCCGAPRSAEPEGGRPRGRRCYPRRLAPPPPRETRMPFLIETRDKPDHQAVRQPTAPPTSTTRNRTRPLLPAAPSCTTMAAMPAAASTSSTCRPAKRPSSSSTPIRSPAPGCSPGARHALAQGLSRRPLLPLTPARRARSLFHDRRDPATHALETSPRGANWGDFGPDDQLGRLNLITPERIRAAAAEIRAGHTFCLSLPLDFPGGNVLNARRNPPRLRPTFRDGAAYVNFPLAKLEPGAVDVLSDDRYCCRCSTRPNGMRWRTSAPSSMPTAMALPSVSTTTATGPTGHRRPGRLSRSRRLRRPSLRPRAQPRARARHRARGRARVQGRGVMSTAEYHGREFRTIGYDDLMRVLEADAVEVEPGDIGAAHRLRRDGAGDAAAA